MTGPARCRRVGRPPARSGRRADRGQSLIELVLVLPLLLLVLFGILEFANAWRVYQTITNSAREGARRAVIHTSTAADVQQAIDSRMQAGGLDPAKANFRLVICTPGAGSCAIGDPDTVEISYPYQFRMVGPIAELICSSCGSGFGSVTLATRSVMRNE